VKTAKPIKGEINIRGDPGSEHPQLRLFTEILMLNSKRFIELPFAVILFSR
jgi:hypothetical protein